jgi:hypothetical protein
MPLLLARRELIPPGRTVLPPPNEVPADARLLDFGYGDPSIKGQYLIGHQDSGGFLQESVEQPLLADALLCPQDVAKKGNPDVSDPTDIHQETKADSWDSSLGQRVEEFPDLPLQARPPESGNIASDGMETLIPAGLPAALGQDGGPEGLKEGIDRPCSFPEGLAATTDLGPFQAERLESGKDSPSALQEGAAEDSP